MIEFMSGQDYKRKSSCSAGDVGTIPGLGRYPRGRKWQPTPVFLYGKSHGQWSRMGYPPWGLYIYCLNIRTKYLNRITPALQKKKKKKICECLPKSQFKKLETECSG